MHQLRLLRNCPSNPSQSQNKHFSIRTKWCLRGGVGGLLLRTFSWPGLPGLTRIWQHVFPVGKLSVGFGPQWNWVNLELFHRLGHLTQNWFLIGYLRTSFPFHSLSSYNLERNHKYVIRPFVSDTVKENDTSLLSLCTRLLLKQQFICKRH